MMATGCRSCFYWRVGLGLAVLGLLVVWLIGIL
jgi:hypothetical protein